MLLHRWCLSSLPNLKWCDDGCYEPFGHISDVSTHSLHADQLIEYWSNHLIFVPHAKQVTFPVFRFSTASLKCAHKTFIGQKSRCPRCCGRDEEKCGIAGCGDMRNVALALKQRPPSTFALFIRHSLATKLFRNNRIAVCHTSSTLTWMSHRGTFFSRISNAVSTSIKIIDFDSRGKAACATPNWLMDNIQTAFSSKCARKFVPNWTANTGRPKYHNFPLPSQPTRIARIYLWIFNWKGKTINGAQCAVTNFKLHF